MGLIRETVNECIEPYSNKLKMKDREIRFQKQEIRDLQAGLKS